MANTSSAKKAIRVSEKKRHHNLRTKDAMKDARKAVKKAIASTNKKEASELLPKAYEAIDKAAKNNVIHKNTAARYKSRLSKVVNALS